MFPRRDSGIYHSHTVGARVWTNDRTDPFADAHGHWLLATSRAAAHGCAGCSDGNSARHAPRDGVRHAASCPKHGRPTGTAWADRVGMTVWCPTWLPSPIDGGIGAAERVQHGPLARPPLAARLRLARRGLLRARPRRVRGDAGLDVAAALRRDALLRRAARAARPWPATTCAGTTTTWARAAGTSPPCSTTTATPTSSACTCSATSSAADAGDGAARWWPAWSPFRSPCRLPGRGRPAPLDVFWHDDVLLHDTGSGVFEHDPSPLIEVSELHPENDVRIRNIRSALRDGPIADRLRWRDGRHARSTSSCTCTTRRTSRRCASSAWAGGGVLAWSTRVVRGLVAGVAGGRRHGAGGDPGGAGRRVHRSPTRWSGRPATTPSRPPPTATACSRTPRWRPTRRSARGLERVAIIDWDVHHGNGTQECLYRRPDVLADLAAHAARLVVGGASRRPAARWRRGWATGVGHNVNIELGFGSGDGAYVDAMERVVAPIVDAYRPAAGDGGLRAGREPVRSQRPPVRLDGRFPADGRDRPRAGRPPLRRPAGADPGGRLRPVVLGAVHACVVESARDVPGARERRRTTRSRCGSRTST